MGETLTTNANREQNAQRNVIGYEDGFELSKKYEDLFSKDFTTKQTRTFNGSNRVLAFPNAKDLIVASPTFPSSICSEDTQDDSDLSSNEDQNDMSLFQEAAQHVATFAEDLFARQSQDLQQSIEHVSQSSQRHEETLDRISNNLQHLTRILRQRNQRRP